jgi:signal transduction histidine kinase
VGFHTLFQTPLDFLNLFVRPPGDLLYFVAVIAISQASLFMALGERWRRPTYRDVGRYSIASIGIVIAWVLLMVGALYAVVSDQDASNVLPPLERGASVIAILLIGWAFLTADHGRWGRIPNVIFLVLTILIIGGYILTGVQWAGLAETQDFNLSVYGVAWSVIPTVLSVLGIVLMLVYFRWITDAPLKLVFFVILLVGYGGTLFQITRGTLIGDYAGPARLALLAALPILPAVIYRMVINHLQSEILYPTGPQLETPLASPTEAKPQEESFSIKPPETGILSPANIAPNFSPMQRDSIQLLRTLGLILEEATPASIPERIVSAGLEMLKAEVGAVLTLQDANYADVAAAYDKTMSRAISGMALNLDNQPTLVNTIERRLQRPLYVDRNVDELRDLYNRLDIEKIGPTYFQPLMSGKELVAILVIGMPYSNRELEEAERELLKGIGIIAGNLLALSFAARDARLKAEERAIQALVQGIPIDDVKDDTVLAAHQEMQANLQLSRDQISELNRQVMQLKVELDHERNRVTSVMGDTEEGLSVSQRILALNDEQQQLREERERLAARLQEAETALAGAVGGNNDSVLKTMIDMLQREKDDLLIQRDNLHAELSELRDNGGVQTTPQIVQEVLERMSQEKARMEAERDQLGSKLTDIERQLKALGIENGPAGIAQLIGQLSEQRALLQAKLENLTLERDALLNERTKFEQAILEEKERETRLQALQNELKYLASDREAITKQRDQIRIERDELFTKQEAIKQHRARLLAEASGYQLELAESHQEQAKIRAQMQQLADERSNLLSQRDRLSAEKQALETERDLLMARSDGNRERLQQLGEDGVGSLTKMIEEVSEQRNQLEQELNETRSALAAVQNQLDLIQVRTNVQTEGTSSTGQPYQAELMLGMVQELRTPLTSIVGYIDLLMDESAGILGEMQRKFLQRVASNITRLTYMLNDLTRVTALDNAPIHLTPEPLNVVGVIEDAISSSTYQFREKGLSVNLNLHDNIPDIRADRDAISQIINQLLTNAYLASPPGSPIYITAHQQQVKLSKGTNLAQSKDCLLVSVEDRGGGIAQEDIARVFARKYKAENPLINGLGDTGVGLSIAKTLAEAHGGGLWLETRENIGSIFYFALPLETELEPEGI